MNSILLTGFTYPWLVDHTCGWYLQCWDCWQNHRSPTQKYQSDSNTILSYKVCLFRASISFLCFLCSEICLEISFQSFLKSTIFTQNWERCYSCCIFTRHTLRFLRLRVRQYEIICTENQSKHTNRVFPLHTTIISPANNWKCSQ